MRPFWIAFGATTYFAILWVMLYWGLIEGHGTAVAVTVILAILGVSGLLTQLKPWKHSDHAEQPDDAEQD
jgi:hypothetical protein